MRKFKKIMVVNYQHEHTKESEEVFEGAIKELCNQLIEKRLRLMFLLKSSKYRDIYRKLREDNDLLAEFILYD